MSNEENFLYTLWLNFTTVLRLAEVRGYTVKSQLVEDSIQFLVNENGEDQPEEYRESLEKQSFDEKLPFDYFKAVFGETDQNGKIDFVKVKENLYSEFETPEGDLLMVSFISSPMNMSTVGKAVIEQFIRDVRARHTEGTHTTAIIVIEKGLSNDGGGIFESFRDENITLQAFDTNELLTPCIDHNINPPGFDGLPNFELVPKKEIPSLLREMGISNVNSLPAIMSTDPIVKFYGWGVEDIVRIRRDEYYLDVLTPHQYYYRKVKRALKKK